MLPVVRKVLLALPNPSLSQSNRKSNVRDASLRSTGGFTSESNPLISPNWISPMSHISFEIMNIPPGFPQHTWYLPRFPQCRHRICWPLRNSLKNHQFKLENATETAVLVTVTYQFWRCRNLFQLVLDLFLTLKTLSDYLWTKVFSSRD